MFAHSVSRIKVRRNDKYPYTFKTRYPVPTSLWYKHMAAVEVLDSMAIVPTSTHDPAKSRMSNKMQKITKAGANENRAGEDG